MQSLKEIGLKYKTDKATEHQYCDFYEQHLSHLRFDKIKLLEIGIYKNQSLMMWKEYFPNAEIHGIDIVDYTGNMIEGVHYHCFNVENIADITRFSQQHSDWDIIIDDGGHTMKQQQFAFKYLWKSLKSSGIFIMEDLHTSFKKWINSHNTNGDPTTYQMIQSLKNKNDFLSAYFHLEEYRLCMSQVKSVDIWTRDPNNMSLSVTSVIKK